MVAQSPRHRVISFRWLSQHVRHLSISLYVLDCRSGTLAQIPIRVRHQFPTVIASAAKQSRAYRDSPARDCFVAQGVPRNDSGNLVEIWSNRQLHCLALYGAAAAAVQLPRSLLE
jgi:hypothetical protein